MSVIRLQAHQYRAEIQTCGSALNLLTFEGRNLIEPCPPQPRYHGSILAPWPNRIEDGRYCFNKGQYKIPVNESSRNNALHGLVDRLEWEIFQSDDDFLQLATILPAGQAYPTTLSFNSIFSLTKDGLFWNIRVENIGKQSAPYGVSIHPYLLTGSNTSVDEFTLQFNSEYFMEVDEERLLPIGICEVGMRDFDFNHGLVIGKRFIDHAFQIPKNASNNRVKVTDSNGVGSFMQFDKNAKWIQIHTADRDGGKDARRCIAVEPMSCPPDAFNSGLDIITLEPHQQHEMSWLIGHIN